MSTAALAPWLQAFAWGLVHFLWEGALIGCAAYLALRFAHRPQTRYLVGCLGLLAMALAFLATVAAARPEALAIEPAATFSGVVTVLPPDLREQLHARLPWILLAWSAGSGALALRLGAGLLWLYGPCLQRARPAPAALEASLERLREAFRHPRPVRLVVSDLVDSPLVVGFWRAVILVPAAALLALPEASLEAVLAHELAHITRRDFLVNFLQNVAEVVFFYHPAVWWLSREIRAEREHCCDDAAAVHCGGGLRFAQALADLEALRHGPPTQLAPSGHGGSLMHRIKRLLMPMLPTQTLTRPGLLALAAVTVLASGVHWTPLGAAAPEPPPKPAVVSLQAAPAAPAQAEPTRAALYQLPLEDPPDAAARSSAAPLPVPDGPVPAPAPRPGAALGQAPRIWSFHGMIPAFDSARFFRGVASISGGGAASFEIPPHSRLTLTIRPDGDEPFRGYMLLVGRKGHPEENDLRWLENTSDQTQYVGVRVWPPQFERLHGAFMAMPGGPFILEVERSWDPAAQDPRAKAVPFTQAAIKALPLVKLGSMQVWYHPRSLDYPPAAQAARIEGLVRLELVVDREGWPVQVTAKDGPAGLRAAAEDYGWRFCFSSPPARMKYKAVRVELDVDFRLDQAAPSTLDSPAPHSPFRFNGVFIPAHAAMATIQGNASRNRFFSFEIPANARLGLDVKAAGEIPRSKYRLEVVRPDGPRGFNERAFNNTSGHAVIVDVEVLPSRKANDGPGLSQDAIEAGPFTLQVTRTWDPAAQDPRAKAAPFPKGGLEALPEVAFADLQVDYRPEKPTYPPEALAAKAEAAVTLRVAVGRDGIPLYVESEGGAPEFRAAAEAFAWRWVFFPPKVGKENRAVRVSFGVNFKLN